MANNTIQDICGNHYRYSNKDEYMRKISLLLPKDMYESVSEISINTDRSKSQMIRNMIQMYLDQYYEWEKKNKKR